MAQPSEYITAQGSVFLSAAAMPVTVPTLTIVALQVDIAVDPLDGTTLVSQVSTNPFARKALPCPALAVQALPAALTLALLVLKA